ncbi:MAG: hypothetical protein HA488_01990, partial [Candidatus Verstraetearchaeota archaeon]|nr:hypothetical protein [Candidatus Verstraetearchaeota archaeon]
EILPKSLLYKTKEEAAHLIENYVNGNSDELGQYLSIKSLEYDFDVFQNKVLTLIEEFQK